MAQNESRDRATIRALTEIDRDLAALFTRGRALCNEPDDHALAYLIAHVGRELTNGIVRALEPNKRASRPLADDERLAERIGKALGLSREHHVVRNWTKLHRLFQRSAHVRTPDSPKPDLAPLRPAFSELADLLYGLVGDYFQTQAEIDVLADSGDPAAVSIAQVRNLLLRPVQRRRFFSRLQKPEWIKPLAEAGLFQHPPGRVTHEDGSWQARDWPEGAYLVRMSSIEPSLVIQNLGSVPDDNDNPAIWRIVADAIVALPADHGAALARKLARSVHLGFSPLFSYSVLEAAITLAKGNHHEAFVLAEALLMPANVELPNPTTTSDTEYAEQLRERRHRIAWQDKWVLASVDDYTLDQIVDKLLPLLDILDPDRTVDLLIDRLDRTSELVVRAERMFNAAIASVDHPHGSAAYILDLDEPEIDSRRWCRSLVHADVMSGIRARLARETFKRRPSFAKLAKRKNEIFQRMLLARKSTIS